MFFIACVNDFVPVSPELLGRAPLVVSLYALKKDLKTGTEYDRR